MPDMGTVLIALIGSGGVGAIVGAWAALRKANAEADVTVGEAWSAVAKRHEGEITALKSELDCLRQRVDAMVAERTELLLRVASLKAALERERETSATLRTEVDTLKGRVRELEGRTG